MINQEQEAGDIRSTLIYQVSIKKDLSVRSCSVFNEQLFLRGLLNFGGDVSRGRARAVCAATLRNSVSTQIRKKIVQKHYMLFKNHAGKKLFPGQRYTSGTMLSRKVDGLQSQRKDSATLFTKQTKFYRTRALNYQPRICQ